MITVRCRQASAPGVTPTPPPVTVSVAAPVRPVVSARMLVSAPAQRGARLTVWMLVALSVVALGTALAWRELDASRFILANLELVAAQHHGPPPAAVPPAATAEVAGGWRIRHDGHVPLHGGVLLFPRTFAPAKDGYDLIVHFHGNVQIVHESVEQAGLNAALAVINLGVGSDKYRLPYDVPGAFEELLAEIQAGLVKRGIARPRLRRLALTAWSAGYGGIESVLEGRRAPHAEEDPLDAILVLDGVHAGFVDDDPRRLSPSTMRVWVRAARAAADGQLFMLLTHSEIDPIDYAGTMRTHRHLLEQVGTRIKESPMLPMPARIDLPSARTAVKEHRRMVPISDTRLGLLHVLGFEGETPDHHSAHLTQMAVVALPELAARWGKVPPPPLDETATKQTSKEDSREDEPTEPKDDSSKKDAPRPTEPKQVAAPKDSKAKAEPKRDDRTAAKAGGAGSP